jgi:hypothetical protein
LASFWVIFLSSEIAVSISRHIPFFVITDYDVQFIVWSGSVVCTCRLHNVITLPLSLLSTDFGTCSYQCSLSSFTHIQGYS